ncbi:MAG: flagellar basal body P-ring formation chaperone FlgA [Candidatus Eisenbacteria bacterium]
MRRDRRVQLSALLLLLACAAGGSPAQGESGEQATALTPAAGAREGDRTVHSEEELKGALDAAVAAAFPGRAAHWDFSRAHAFDSAPAEGFELVAPQALKGGRNWFHLRPLYAGAGAYLLPVDIAWDDTVWVSVKAFRTGHVFAPGDVERSVRRHTYAPGELAADPTGLRLLAPLPAGGIVTSGMVGHPPLVRRGDQVRLIYRGAGLLITTRAEVMEEGWADSTIRLRPSDGQRECRGRVRNAEEVEVILP